VLVGADGIEPPTFAL